MSTYVLHRLLIMIPTFFGISLVVFVVLNLAPGRPGSAQQAGDLSVDAQSDQSQESYRIFLEQFNLDKPILLNTRFAVSHSTIQRRVAVAAGLSPATTSERLEAQDELENLGGYAVPALVEIARSTKQPEGSELRDAALTFLRLGARRRLRDPYDPSPSAETRAYNRDVDSENAYTRTLSYAANAPAERKRSVFDAWMKWHDVHRERFEYDWQDKARIALTDTRFFTYWKNLVQLDFGVSLVTREPVIATLLSKLRYSLSPSVTSLLLAYALAIPLGLFSAVRRGTRADRAVTLTLFALYSLPSFFVASLLLVFLSEGSDYPLLRLFPTGGWQSPDSRELTTLAQLADIGWHLVLPLVCLTYGSLAALSRYMRTGLLDVIQADYIRTARAKGLEERVVIGKHAFRNGLLPILTLLAGLLPAILGGSVIVEYIFGIPGMGLWVVESINARDYNAIMAIQLVSTLLVLFGILLTDLSYAVVDPRIRYR
jgi:peptide/nickel transport system permease protein